MWKSFTKTRSLNFTKITQKNLSLVHHSPLKGVLTRSNAMGVDSRLAFLSSIESKNFQQTKKEVSWMIVMQELNPI